MELVTINAEQRTETGSVAVKKARRVGKVPAVIYGHKQDPKALLLSGEEVGRIVAHRIKMVTLNINGVGESVLVKDVQFDTFGEEVLHVDFERIALDELVEVECPVAFIGVPKGAAAGGVVEHPVTDLEIECLPGNIPAVIKVAISALEIGNTIHVKDIKAPEGVKILTDPDAILVTIRPPAKVEEEVVAAPAAGEGSAEPELIRRERAAEEEEEKKKGKE